MSAVGPPSYALVCRRAAVMGVSGETPCFLVSIPAAVAICVLTGGTLVVADICLSVFTDGETSIDAELLEFPPLPPPDFGGVIAADFNVVVSVPLLMGGVACQAVVRRLVKEGKTLPPPPSAADDGTPPGFISSDTGEGKKNNLIDNDGTYEAKHAGRYGNAAVEHQNSSIKGSKTECSTCDSLVAKTSFELLNTRTWTGKKQQGAAANWGAGNTISIFE